MLYRKISRLIESHLRSRDKRILIIDGARQVGKTFIIRATGQEIFENFIEVNMSEDKEGARLFQNVHSISDFYLQVSSLAGAKMKEKENTLIFIDEIQAYPHLFPLLKFLADDNRYTYIASGSLLVVTLFKSPALPAGYTRIERMYPLDFEEFLIATGAGQIILDALRTRFLERQVLDENMHTHILNQLCKYLLIGGLPQAVNTYIETSNIHEVRTVHNDIRQYYKADASQYDREHRLVVHRLYDLIPSNMENKKKRVIVKEIEGKGRRQSSQYLDEYEYLISSGIALNVQAVSEPAFPLTQSVTKNLVKFYLNDPGLLSSVLYGDNIRAVLDDDRSINLGALYETVVACELKAHGHELFYYDNRSRGEVDFLINDYDNLTALPLEIKSGRDYIIHSAISNLVSNGGYRIKKGIVFSNSREIREEKGILYLPIYFIMFL